jgi:hypothetical protein
MSPKTVRYLAWCIVILTVVACSPQAAPETPDPDQGQVPMGFTEDGVPYRGDPNAPVTLAEHSEFQ